MFKDLIASVREGGATLRGKRIPSRQFEMNGPDFLTRFPIGWPPAKNPRFRD